MPRQIVSFRLFPYQRTWLSNVPSYVDYDSFFRNLMDECKEIAKSIDDDVSYDYPWGRLQPRSFKLEPDTYERIKEYSKIYGFYASEFVRKMITAKAKKLC